MRSQGGRVVGPGDDETKVLWREDNEIEGRTLMPGMEKKKWAEGRKRQSTTKVRIYVRALDSRLSKAMVNYLAVCRVGSVSMLFQGMPGPTMRPGGAATS